MWLVVVVAQFSIKPSEYSLEQSISLVCILREPIVTLEIIMSSVEALMESIATLVPYPVQRFTPWDDLSNATKALVEGIGYNSRRWEKPGSLNLEYREWSSICRKVENVNVEECDTTLALRELGFTPASWDCW
jgi:hypothetical protein